jgi:hypothetical protein
MKGLNMDLVKKISLLLVFMVVSSVVSSGCSGTNSQVPMKDMIPISSLPSEVRNAPVTVQQAYQFAVANPEVLTQIPCYCGCGAMGHTSNYSCYVAGKNEDGSLKIDSHALGCSICVDITQDTMRLLQEGKAVPEIRSYVDHTYAQYGPSNMP